VTPAAPPAAQSRDDGDTARWVLWGSRLSPFALKLEAMLRFHGLPHRWLPPGGGFAETLRGALRRRAVVRRRRPLTWPPPDPLDEFPLVPFLFGPAGENLFDSSAIATWLDARAGSDEARLRPEGPGGVHLAVRLVDEALDEVGLYLVHHNRWVVSARDNDAGARLAHELGGLLGPLAGRVGRGFAARQVRRLPYLMSVAPRSGAWDDLPPALRPPSPPGFPSTHALLEEAFERLLAALEPLLATRPFLFGQRFTLADASVFGQLATNRSDPSADARIAARAPSLHAWLVRLERGEWLGHRADAPLVLDAGHGPLMAWIETWFVPLMQQNEAAFTRARERGETRFNERAFATGRALYDGVLAGHPFRAVARTFQVKVWQALLTEWRALPDRERLHLPALGSAAAGPSRPASSSARRRQPLPSGGSRGRGESS